MKKILLLLNWLVIVNIFSQIEVNKALIVAAGLGTRLLPITKSVAKELMPVLDQPALQYILEECKEAKIDNFGVLINKDKLAIKNFLTFNNNNSKSLEKINNIINSSKFDYIYQEQPLGTGHAVLICENFIGDNYFAVIYPDDIITNQSSCIGELVKTAQKYNATVIAVQEVPKENISSYGVVSIKTKLEENVYEISGLVEKPAAKDAPSNLAVVGRYVLSPKIFDSIRFIAPRFKGEIPLTDAIFDMMQKGEKILVCKITGQRLDIGTTIGWLESNLKIGLQNSFYKNLIIKTVEKNLQ